jgi:hypothetical protein
MIKNISNFVSLIFLSLALLTHILKSVYMFYKPIFLSRFKFLVNNMPTKTELLLYYILTILCCYYSISHILK